MSLARRSPFLVLSIETSCDDTSVAIVSSCRKILSQVTIDQHEHHRPFGGIVPRLAAQLHRQNLPGAIKKCFEESAVGGLKDIDFIAATRGPGLANSLSAGFEAGRAIASASALPFYAIHHMEGHALVARLSDESIKFPFLAFLISGGHTLLVLVRQVGKYSILGTTTDDSIGEALDKATRMLDIELLDGQSPAAALEKLAKLHTTPIGFRLPLPMEKCPGMDFSFSGLKTALKYYLEEQNTGFNKASLAYEFQRAASAHLEDRLGKAIKVVKDEGVKDVVIGGGVAKNGYIRESLRRVVENGGFSVKFAPFELCTDNAAMIGWTAIENIWAGTSPLDPEDVAEVLPEWSLDKIKLKNIG